METDNQTQKGNAGTRHCAYCLQLCGFPAKLCSGCRKRAYCCKECQVKDWSNQGNGQRHVNWCRRHECGEEDVDWEVVPIPNKGLGIRAKKLIPAGFKIIVEPTCDSPFNHPGFMNLEPEGGTMELKFKRNIFKGENMSQAVVALRIARVNHACKPNASTIYDETACVAILYSQRDIHPGEEIAICYYSPFFDFQPYSGFVGALIPESISIVKELNLFRKFMSSTHGIICPSDCFCYDSAILALVRKGRKIQPTIIELSSQNKVGEALEFGDKLLRIQRRLNISWTSVGITEINLFNIAVKKSETLPRAREYIRSAIELFRNICPYSENMTKAIERLLKNPDGAGL